MTYETTRLPSTNHPSRTHEDPPEGTSAHAPVAVRETHPTPIVSKNLLFPAGWPFVWFFVGYPLWWLLGITWLAPFLAACVMIAHLRHRRPLLVPRHFGLWILFLICAALGIFLVHLDAPGALPQGGFTPYLTWGFRFVTLLEATIFFVYICTLRREFTWLRISRTLAWVFVYVAIGGMLGVLFPFVQFPSAFEVLLPHRLASEPFVNSIVHPWLAQLQTHLGSTHARPSAPFPYANSWGHNYICFLPFFIAAWATGSRRRKLIGLAILGISIIPLIYSQDRAVWIAAGFLIVLVAAFFARRGHYRPLATVILISLLLAFVVMITPLRDQIGTQFSSDTHTSNQGRANLSTLAVKSTVTGSPVLGFGTTRQMQGSFRSISAGATSSCPGCNLPALGTQGIVWYLVFGTGLAGLLFYFSFYLLKFWKALRHTFRASTLYPLLPSAVIAVFLITAPVYGLRLTTELAVMCAVAVSTRLAQPTANDRGHRATSDEATTDLFHYARLARQQGRLLIAGSACGLLLGALWQVQRGPSYNATASVLINSGQSVQANGSDISLDSVARLAQGTRVKENLKQVGDDAPIDKSLTVTAYPSTRILNLSYTSDTAGNARRGARIVADTLTGSSWSLGQVVSEPRVRRDNQGWIVSPISGAAVGFIVAAAVATVSSRRGQRLGSLLDNPTVGNPVAPVLATVRPSDEQTYFDAAATLEGHTSDECIPADSLASSLTAALKVSQILTQKGPHTATTFPARIVLFAGTESRVPQLLRERDCWRRCGAYVSGLVVVESPGVPFSSRPRSEQPGMRNRMGVAHSS